MFCALGKVSCSSCDGLMFDVVDVVVVVCSE